KTLSLDMVDGDASSRKRIETQVLHFDGREFQGYSYEWNDEQTDAALVDRGGKNRALQIQDAHAPGGRRSYTWRYSSRAECIRCHNPWSEYTLAFNGPQLNRTQDFGEVSDNQIRTYRHIGLLSDITEDIDPNEPPGIVKPPRSPETLPHLTPPFDESADIHARARSYLHVNCGHCHRFNGGGSSYIYLQHDLPLADVKAVGVRPTQGTFGIHDAHLLAPGDPYRSVVYFRLAKTGPGHMPHLGAKAVDDRALALVHDWIRQLPVRMEDTAKIERLIALDEAASLAREREETPRNEWQLARQMARQAKREAPNDDDLAKAKQQTAKKIADAVPQRAEERRKLTDELLANPTRAVMLAAATRADRLPAAIRTLVMESALRSETDAAIRDLFDAFLPEEQRTKRLGDAINPADILKL
ncbi:MAG: hypothetical protein WD176_01955, partial [Pirellulales bacterium]